MAMSAEQTSNFVSPSTVMVTFPSEWKNLEWDEKLQTNKQTKNCNSQIGLGFTKTYIVGFNSVLFDVKWTLWDRITNDHPV